MKTTKIFFSLLVAGSAMVAVTSCADGDPNSPGVEFMPDMYRSPSLETNMKQDYMGDSLPANRMPVRGTVARGYMPDPYQYDTAGYENSANLRNPVPLTQATLDEGKDLYTKYCTHCHGGTGSGDGLVGTKLPGPPPAYSSPPLMALSEGKMFYSISYGKGMMGPHAPLMTQEERWKVIHYINVILQKRGSLPATEMGVINDSIQKRTDDAKGSTPSQPGGKTTTK